MDTLAITDQVDRRSRSWGPDAVRYLAALLFLSNVSWKVPTAFGDNAGSCRALCGYVRDGVAHPVFPGSAWFFDTLVGPHLAVFGWTTLIVEASLGALFLSGRYLRVAGVIGILQSLGIMAAVANTPGEWYWSYLLMAGLSLTVIVVAPGVRPTAARPMAVIVLLYGAVVAITHAGAGLAGDLNASWTLFGGSSPFPGDFGRNVFPGSIALGALLAVLAVVVWLLADADQQVRVVCGWGLVVISAMLLFTYRSEGLILRLGSKATTASVLAALGLSLVPEPHPRDRTVGGAPAT